MARCALAHLRLEEHPCCAENRTFRTVHFPSTQTNPPLPTCSRPICVPPLMGEAPTLRTLLCTHIYYPLSMCRSERKLPKLQRIILCATMGNWSVAPPKVDISHCSGIVHPYQEMGVPQERKKATQGQEHYQEFQKISVRMLENHTPTGPHTPSIVNPTPGGQGRDRAHWNDRTIQWRSNPACSGLTNTLHAP